MKDFAETKFFRFLIMYSSFHSAAGILIGLACPGPAGLALATASHFPLDCLYETACYKDMKQFFIIDGLIFHGMMAIGCWHLRPDSFWFLMACMFAANAADAFDKFRDYGMHLDQILWCHKPWWPCWWNPDAGATFVCNAGSVIFVLLALATK